VGQYWMEKVGQDCVELNRRWSSRWRSGRRFGLEVHVFVRLGAAPGVSGLVRLKYELHCGAITLLCVATNASGNQVKAVIGPAQSPGFHVLDVP
ncbi:MAG: hypothetical protein ABI605_14640, partial [Rhizobacter sp.]